MDKNTTTTRQPETINGYRYTDGEPSWNGRPRFWLTERLTRDGGRTTYNGKTTEVTQYEIDNLREDGFTVEPDTHIAD